MESLLPDILSQMNDIVGYIYPNEYELHWSMLVVVYPYLTGLVAGAFILASLERVFNVKVLQPVYRLSLLTALAFLIVAPWPLLAHLGHPERSFQMFLTPHTQSAMAMFGFVYAWYLMVILLLEIWFDYRKEFVVWSRECRGIKKWIYKILTLGATDISEEAVRFDEKIGRAITILGIPSAFLLHGYVGFIFGSVKANPWWSSVLMPIVFLFSAIVSGMALVLLIYMVSSMFRMRSLNMACINKLSELLLYAIIVDFSLEVLDFIQRLYEAEESIHILSQMISNRLFISLIVTQIILGTLVPMVSIAWARFGRIPDEMKRLLYFVAAVLIQIGIFSTRWNVVIGGQLFSKSLRGLTVYKMELLGLEGVLMSGALLIFPFILLYLITRIVPWSTGHPSLESANAK